MSNDRTYNGWTNYETWLVNLWIQNDPALLAVLHADVLDAGSLYDAKQVLQAWMDNELDLFLEAAGTSQGGLFADLIKGALDEVNWYEIVRNWRGEGE